MTGLRNSHKCTAKWRPRPVCASSKRQQLVLKQMKILSLSEEIAIATSYSFYRYKNKQLIIFWSDRCFTKVSVLNHFGEDQFVQQTRADTCSTNWKSFFDLNVTFVLNLRSFSALRYKGRHRQLPSMKIIFFWSRLSHLHYYVTLCI